jgi:hypothetical protein
MNELYWKVMKEMIALEVTIRNLNSLSHPTIPRNETNLRKVVQERCDCK